jgi:hypothetical protein
MFGIEIPAWAIGVGIIIIAGSIGGGLKRLLSGERGSPPAGRGARRELGRMVGGLLESRLGAVDELRSKVGEIEDLQRRVAELEERVDFTERLLAKQRDGERLAPPKS